MSRQTGVATNGNSKQVLVPPLLNTILMLLMQTWLCLFLKTLRPFWS